MGSPARKKQLHGDDYLSERSRAEDILLGALGYGEDARIVSVEPTSIGYQGVGAWSDGEKFDFTCDEALDDLEKWALGILTAQS